MRAKQQTSDEHRVGQFFQAIRDGDSEVVRRLVDSDPVLLDRYSPAALIETGLIRNALHEAIRAGNLDVIAALLEVTSRTGRRPEAVVLVQAVRGQRAGLIHALLKAGADLNERDFIGSFTWTPLALAGWQT